MTRSWKHILFVAGLVGVIGMFVPVIEIRHDVLAVSLTPKQLTFGLARTHALLDAKLPAIVEAKLPASVKSGREDARLVARASRHVGAMYIPAALMMLMGLGLLFSRVRFGRPIAAVALLLGLLGVGCYFGLRYGIDYGLSELGAKRTQINLLNGAILVFLSGIGGIFVGIGALARPQPPRKTATNVTS